MGRGLIKKARKGRKRQGTARRYPLSRQGFRLKRRSGQYQAFILTGRRRRIGDIHARRIEEALIGQGAELSGKGRAPASAQADGVQNICIVRAHLTGRSSRAGKGRIFNRIGAGIGIALTATDSLGDGTQPLIHTAQCALQTPLRPPRREPRL